MNAPRALGQGALEYLLLIGGAVLVSTIVLLIILSSASSTNEIINTNIFTFQNALGVSPIVAGPASFDSDSNVGNVSYGSDPDQRFDFYSPVANGASTPGPWPVILWAHGGGFNSGTEDDLLQLGGINELSQYTSAGYAFISVQARLGAHAVFPDQTCDVARAVQYVRDHASELNVDPARVIGYGVSAGGAHFGFLSFGPGGAALQTLCNGIVTSPTSARPNAFVNFRTPTDFRFMDETQANIGNPSNIGAGYFCFSSTYGEAAANCPADLRDFSILYQIEQHTSGAAVPVFSYYTGATSAAPPPPFTEIHDYQFGVRLQQALATEYGVSPSAPENTYYQSLTSGFAGVIIPWLASVGMGP